MSNVNELLYMARMNDETAMGLLMEEMKPQMRYEIREITNTFSPLRNYEEDFMQEAGICLYVAMETFREDKRCSFPSYLTVIVKRRIWALAKKLSHTHSIGFNHTLALDYPYTDEETLLNILENPDAMSNPEYYLRYSLALESLKGLCRRLTERESVIYDTWIKGERYEVSRKTLGLTYKQYEGRVRRLRSRIREAVYSA